MASVDIVIPNYNYGRYLEACVKSALAQDGAVARVLIVDNASTDDSVAIARRLAAADLRVELLLRPENLGPHASFNAGIDWARADYFLLLFADDVLVPGALRRAIATMEKDRSLAFCYGQAVAIRDDAPLPEIRVQPLFPPVELMSGRAFIERFCDLGVFQIPGPSILVRTSVQQRTGHYRTSLPHSDDYEVWLRLAMHGSVAALDCVQAGIRTHAANRSTDLWTHQSLHVLHTAAAAESFFHHEGRWLDGAEALRKRARRGIAQRAYWSAVSHALQGNAEALRLLRIAFQLSPFTALVPPLGYLLRRRDMMPRVRSLLARALR
ncbi:glycosyl transferase [Shinella sp. SUS2]|uniref:glycosyltransferase family 2 protein n=1 Tax=unclassified Shinella TaxID=2643062 RepID=UPI0006801623|nr:MULTISPECIES: glycosyltransferase family 2 protein [unclassified Shinella]KNY13570.1 glycosyl transferase [Shinella sp. SUS2]KOC72365.1 glycosyl transferase [Shinella sp. GWS1]